MMRHAKLRHAASVLTLWFAGCTPRETLPPPHSPLVATPDAPYRAHLPTPAATTAPRAMPAAQDFTLANGMRVLLLERPGTPLVTARFVSRRGGDEAGNPAGLALLTLFAMREGSTAHGADQMLEALAAHGVEMSGALSPDASGMTARFLAPEAESALGLLAETVISPAFPAALVNYDINTMVTARLEGGGLGTVSHELALASLFGPQSPYGRPAGGFAPELRALNRDTVAAFHRGHYVPGESALVVVGGIDRATLEPLVTHAFGAWPARQPAALPAPALYAPRPGPRFILMHSYGTPQSQIVLALRAPAENAADRLPAFLLAAGLGGMFSSRLNRELRERQAYTYGVHANAEAYRASGVLLIRCAVATDQTEDALREILATLRHVRSNGLDAAEFAAAQALARQEAETSFDSDEGAVGALTALFVYGRPADYYATLGARIAAVTSEDVRRVAQSTLDPGAMRVAVGGDKYEIESGLRGLGLGAPEVYVNDRRR